MIDKDRLKTLVWLYIKGSDKQSKHCYLMEMLKPRTFCCKCDRRDICTTPIIDVR